MSLQTWMIQMLMRVAMFTLNVRIVCGEIVDKLDVHIALEVN